MNGEIEIWILKNRLSGGEQMKMQRIAAKPEYSEKEVKFALALAARTLKKVRNSLSIDQVSIKPEGMNFLIKTKSITKQ